MFLSHGRLIGGYIKSGIWLSAFSKSSNGFAELPPSMTSLTLLFSPLITWLPSLFCCFSTPSLIFQTDPGLYCIFALCSAWRKTLGGVTLAAHFWCWPCRLTILYLLLIVLPTQTALYCYFYMYGRFADSKAAGGGPDGGFVLNDVQRQLLGALFHVPLHKNNTPRCGLSQVDVYAPGLCNMRAVLILGRLHE